MMITVTVTPMAGDPFPIDISLSARYDDVVDAMAYYLNTSKEYISHADVALYRYDGDQGEYFEVDHTCLMPCPTT